jgi:hypothetical protein
MHEKWLFAGELSDPSYPPWDRMAAITTEGAVFVPARLAGEDQEAVRGRALRDNEPVLFRAGHVFVRADWVRRVAPASVPTVDTIVPKIRRAAGWGSA